MSLAKPNKNRPTEYHSKHPVHYRLINKMRWSTSRNKFVDVPLAKGADGIAFNVHRLWEGAERYVFRCVEVAKKGTSPVSGRMLAAAVDEWLVAKEGKYEEQLVDAKFHQNMAKLQSRAQRLAESFNARVGGKPEQQITFVQCVIYKVRPFISGPSSLVC